MRKPSRGGCIERWVKRGIADQREEKENRGDNKNEPDQLIEPPVPGGREDPRKILHEGIPHSSRDTKPCEVTRTCQSTMIMPKKRGKRHAAATRYQINYGSDLTIPFSFRSLLPAIAKLLHPTRCGKPRMEQNLVCGPNS